VTSPSPAGECRCSDAKSERGRNAADQALSDGFGHAGGGEDDPSSIGMWA